MTEQEIILRLQEAIDHPFGGYGAPDKAEQKRLIAELMKIPRVLEQSTVPGTYVWWPNDDTAPLVLAQLDAPPEKVAAWFGRSMHSVYYRAQFIGKHRPGARLNFRYWMGRSWRAWRQRNDEERGYHR